MKKDYSDSQVNIFEGHGRDYSMLVPVFIPNVGTDKDLKLVSSWLKFMAGEVTTVSEQEKLRRKYIDDKKEHPTEPVVWIGLSHQIMNVCGLSDMLPCSDEYFEKHMKREENSWHDYRANTVEFPLEEFYLNDDINYVYGLSALMSISGDDPITVRNKADYILSHSFFNDKRIIYQREFGFRGTREGVDGFVGPLGFIDGLSNERKPNAVEKIVKVEERYLRNGSKSRVIGYGSYLVYRKLAVNAVFMDLLISKLSKEYKISEEKAAAMYMGRYRNGFPIVLESGEVLPGDFTPAMENDVDFDFKNDIDGLKCPLRSHIRVVNPREGKNTKAEIIRRSLVYNDSGDFPVDRDHSRNQSKGLLFLSYQASIKQQLGPILKNIAGIVEDGKGENEHIKRNSDALMYRSLGGRLSSLTFPKSYASDDVEENIEFGTGDLRLTHFLGGGCFYVPSRALLKTIGESNEKV